MYFRWYKLLNQMLLFCYSSSPMVWQLDFLQAQDIPFQVVSKCFSPGAAVSTAHCSKCVCTWMG